MFRCFMILGLVTSVCAASLQPQEISKNGAKGDQETAMVKQFMKQLEPAGLNQETTDKIREVFAKAAKEVVAKRKEAGLTAAMLKARTEATKKAREEGKKQKEAREIGLSALNGTEEQKKVLLDTEGMLAKARIEAGKLLNEEQMSKLPKQFQANLKEPSPRKGGK
jgi:hypothetical protein